MVLGVPILKCNRVHSLVHSTDTEQYAPEEQSDLNLCSWLM